MNLLRARLLRTVLAISIPTMLASAAWAAPPCDGRVNNTAAKLLECVTVDGVRQHQAALQTIADANNGHRVSGAAGYDASVAYVEAQMTAAGYQVTVQPFQHAAFFSFTPAVLEQISPAPSGALPNRVMSYSGSGDVTAPVSTLPMILGCNPSDWAGFPPGHIALVSRGACTFAVKATNAHNAGAHAVIIYNNLPGTLSGTLGSGFSLDIPVTGIDQNLGLQLASTSGLVMRVKTDTFRGNATSYNVLAESVDGDPNNVVMAGAHLDSVDDGPGIQDNGSGSAAILEVALQMAKVKPRNKVRFAWWGSHEAGRLGVDHYLSSLTAQELQRIALYLDFEMIGSPNFVRFVHDGDGSTFGNPGPPGSGAIEALFEGFYAARSLASEPTDRMLLTLLPFLTAGIPSGGLFGGSTGIKTAEQAAVYGGTAGQPYDPCWHLACDTFANINLEALDVHADAAANAILQFAMNTAAVNGARGKGNFGPRR